MKQNLLSLSLGRAALGAALLFATSVTWADSPDCMQLKNQAQGHFGKSQFDEASQSLESFKQGKCAMAIDDSIALIFSHYKAAGFDVGAMARAMMAAAQDNSDWFSNWKKELTQPLSYSQKSVAHLNRAVYLHEHLESYPDKDTYFFRKMAIRAYRAFYLTQTAHELTTDLGNQIYVDLDKARVAIAQTVKYTEGVKDRLQALMDILDADHSRSVSEAELRAFVKRYR